MSSTNTTPNYKLPQFINTDVPSWLGDFNDAMSKIDTQMKANDTKATGASTNAENANSSATQALETANQASTTANGANTNATNALSAANNANENANTAKQNAQTALSTANSASGNASSALSMAQNANTNATKALNGLDKFNLNNFRQWTNTNNIPGLQTNVSNLTSSNINLATDNSNSIFKLYGELQCNVTASGTIQILLSGSSLRPSKEVKILDVGIALLNGTIYIPSLTVKTNGDILLECWVGQTGHIQVVLFNMLYILQSFEQSIPTE